MTAEIDLTSFIAADGRSLTTDSRAVALAFGKRHRSVLRVIDAMRSSPSRLIAEHALENFKPSTYLDVDGKRRRMYRMTPEAVAGMGSRGEDARVVRIRFLNAFEEVAARLAAAEQALVQQLELSEARVPRRVD